MKYKPNCGKIHKICHLEVSFKKFLDPDPDAGDFQNLMIILLAQRYILGNMYAKIRLLAFRAYVKLLIDKKVDKCWVEQNLLGGGYVSSDNKAYLFP